MVVLPYDDDNNAVQCISSGGKETVHSFIGVLWYLCRLYTGIHALKPKLKSKTGAISESTTALNVDQTMDQTNTVSSTTAPLLPPLPNKGATVNDQNMITAPRVEAMAAVGASAAVKKKEGLSAIATAAKIQVLDKKKMDARKKSLKRL